MPERNALTIRMAGLVSAIVLTSAADFAPEAAVPIFNVKRIGALGGCCSTPTGINNKGWVVGQSRTADGRRYALLWIGDSAVDIGALPGDTESIANGINDRGEIAGTSGAMYRDTAKVFIWQDGSMRRIAFSDPYAHQSFAINDSGNFIGATALEGGCESFACIKDSLWTIAESLPDIDYYNCLSVWDINNRNQVAVAAFSGGYSRGTFIWENGQVTLIDTGSYVATCINDHGQIAGYFGVTDSLQSYWEHPCVWRSGAIRRLDSMDGRWGECKDINESGWVVGRCSCGSLAVRAFLYCCDSDTLYDLNDLIPASSGWTLEEAVAINDSGWIVGTGTYQEQANQGFLLTPVTTSVSPGFRASREPRAGAEFRIAREGGAIVIRMSPGLPSNREIRILDNRGRLIRRLPASGGGRALWDGRDAFRRPVPEGAYVIVVRDQDVMASSAVLFTK